MGEVVSFNKGSARDVMEELGMPFDDDVVDIVCMTTHKDGMVQMSCSGMTVERLYFLGHIIQLQSH